MICGLLVVHGLHDSIAMHIVVEFAEALSFT